MSEFTIGNICKEVQRIQYDLEQYGDIVSAIDRCKSLDELLCEIEEGTHTIVQDNLTLNSTEKKKDINQNSEEINKLKQEKEIIKEKLLKYILDYHKIGNDNWNMGLHESVETIHDEVKALFKNPLEWEYVFDCDDCTYFQKIPDNYEKAHCKKHDKKIGYWDEGCDDFAWD